MTRRDLSRLDDDQLAVFDTDHMRGSRWEAVQAALRDRFAPDRELRVLDIGGGNGNFADQILSIRPHAKVTVLDPSSELLNRNLSHPGKTLYLGGVESLESFASGTFDVVAFNWVLHHLVTPSYRESDEAVRGALRDAARLIDRDGIVSVFENEFDGWLIDSLPSRTIHFLTSRARGAVARALRRRAVNTAGVGVCFRSERQLRQMFTDSGLAVERRTTCDTLGYNRVALALLTCRPVRTAHYVLPPAREVAP